MTDYLSEHFSLAELTITRQPLDNTPPANLLPNLTETARQMERVRELLNGAAILVTSAYRSPAVNAAVGGSPTSGHMKGYAVDFIAPRFGNPLAICRKLATSDLKFDQLLQEGTWVHISFDPRMRREVKTKSGDGFVKGLRPAA